MTFFSDMATRNYEAASQANIILNDTDLKPPSTDWLVKYLNEEFQAFKTFQKYSFKPVVFEATNIYHVAIPW